MTTAPSRCYVPWTLPLEVALYSEVRNKVCRQLARVCWVTGYVGELAAGGGRGLKGKCFLAVAGGPRGVDYTNRRALQQWELPTEWLHAARVGVLATDSLLKPNDASCLLLLRTELLGGARGQPVAGDCNAKITEA